MEIFTQGGYAFLARWLHFLAGIMWIGLLYYFNFVQVPAFVEMGAQARSEALQKITWRALWWFRWGAVYTVLFGLVLFYWKYMRGANLRDAEGGLSDRAMWIMLGMTLGLIMAFNVWAIIWPAQRTIIRATKEGQKPPEGLPEKAKLFSRINFIVSGPMLVGMVAANNAIAFTATSIAVTMIVSLAIIHVLLRLSTKVGTSI